MSQRDTVFELISEVQLAAFVEYAALEPDELKTTGMYQRQLWRAIRDLFNSEIDEFQFLDDLNMMIDTQFGRAWRAGAREMGVSPQQFTEEDYTELANRIAQEQRHMYQLADDILRARAVNGSIEPFRVRAGMWANRYNELVNDARVWFGGKQALEWVLGPTEHCATCLMLSGVVARASEWSMSRYKPQGSTLACGGFQCQCSLRATDRALTPGGIPK